VGEVDTVVAEVSNKAVRTYCSLVISSDTDRQLGVTVQKILGIVSNDVVDTQSPELIAARERLAKVLDNPPFSPPRYFWRSSSKDKIDSNELQDHVAWLLSQVKPGRSIREISDHGGSAFLTCFWAGNGRGGGPTLSSSLMRTIASHDVELQFDFYTEDDDESASED
jgi:hypothetical protein